MSDYNYLESLMRNESADKGSIEFIDIDLICENRLNEGREINGIEELAENIKENGLQQPVIAKKDNDHYTLISGHRRSRAVRLLTESGNAYQFADKEIKGKIPCVIVSITDELDEQLAIIVGNDHSDDSKKEKIRRCVALEEIYFKRKERGHDDGEKRKWIAKQSGYSERSVTNYLKDNRSDSKSEKSDFDRFYETLKRLSSYKGKVDIADVDPKIINEVKRMMKDVKEIVYPR